MMIMMMGTTMMTKMTITMMRMMMVTTRMTITMMTMTMMTPMSTKMTSLPPALVQLAVVDERRGFLCLPGHQAAELTLLHHRLLQEDGGYEDEEDIGQEDEEIMV